MKSKFFFLFISGEKKEVFPDSRLWKFPLSGENAGFTSSYLSRHKKKGPVITIGDYFLASCQFLSENNFLILKTGIKAVLKRPGQTDKIDKVFVFLEKHGAFYHPMKTQVVFNDGPACSFVLNGAVSRPGLTLIDKEYYLISRLNSGCLKKYLPRVFGCDVIKTDKGRIGFFLGEWFDGYKEFHATEDQDRRQVAIWESDGTCHYISQTKALPIYKEISRILTRYYDIETFEQIFPWHHAAGDFVVRLEHGKAQVRLITVRGYSPLTEFSVPGKDKKTYILPSLMFFFLT